nr:uncharacterized protein LOC127304165 [Lolium perenne]
MAADGRSPRDGNQLEILRYYNPPQARGWAAAVEDGQRTGKGTGDTARSPGPRDLEAFPGKDAARKLLILNRLSVSSDKSFLTKYNAGHDHERCDLLLCGRCTVVSRGRKSMEAACRIRGWSGKFGVAAPSCKG